MSEILTKSLKVVAGPVVLGENFYPGRLPLVGRLDEILKKSDALVIGPRRSGKTSLIRYHLDNLKLANVRTIYIDLMTTENLYDFYIRVFHAVLREDSKLRFLGKMAGDYLKRFSTTLNEVFDGGVDLSVLIGSPDPGALRLKFPRFDPAKVNRLRDKLGELMTSLSEYTVLVLDEFPELIWKLGQEPGSGASDVVARRKEMTQFLLEGLRVIRQEPETVPRTRSVIVAGSVNLDMTLVHLGLGHLTNDCPKLPVPNLSIDQAWELTSLLFAGHDISIDPSFKAETFVRRQFGTASPFYVQLFVEVLINLRLAAGGKLSFSEESFKGAYKQLILSTKGPRYLRERLVRYYEPNERTVAEKILTQIAKKQFSTLSALTEDDLKSKHAQTDRLAFTDLCAKMAADGLIQTAPDGSGFMFESQLICNFWNHALVGPAFLC